MLLESISPIRYAFGGAAISGEGGGYGFGQISEDKSIELLHYAQSLGVLIFDSAPIYGFEVSEKRIGLAFENIREKVFLISKSGVTWHDNQRVNMSNDPQLTLKMLEQSRKNLRSDYIDLYMVHWPDPKIDIRFTLDIYQKALHKGWIKYCGLCNTHISEIQKAQEVVPISVVQNEFNYFQNSSRELFPFLKEHKISFMGWGTLDKGILSGRVTEKRIFESVDARSWAPWWMKSNKNEKIKLAKQLSEQLKNQGKTLTQFAIEYCLQFPEISQVLIGCRNIEQLTEVVNLIKVYGKQSNF